MATTYFPNYTDLRTNETMASVIVDGKYEIYVQVANAPHTVEIFDADPERPHNTRLFRREGRTTLGDGIQIGTEWIAGQNR